MKIPQKAWIACAVFAAPIALALTVPGAAVAQSSSTPASAGVPLVQIIESVAKRTNKNFIVDPHVTGNAVLLGLDPSKVTYPELLTILQVHGFVAVESDGLVRIVPDSQGRSSPSPVIGGGVPHFGGVSGSPLSIVAMMFSRRRTFA